MPDSKKRKTPLTKGAAKSASVKNVKKFKTTSNDAEWIRNVPPTAGAEFEFDSDPVEESPTPEYSGEDEAASWPSEEDLSEDGGVSLVKQSNGFGISPESRSSQGNRESPQTKLAVGRGVQSSHAKQKALAQERKAVKANADVIARAKKIWEKLRVTSVPSAERKVLIDELFDIVSGRVKELVLKHDAGRIIQTSLKYSNRERRRLIAEELTGEYKQLAASKYAKFTIGKLLSSGDEAIRDLIVPEFYGSVRSLIKHPEAGWILDDIYRGAATNSQKSKLLREWYGAEFAVFDHSTHLGDNKSLYDVLSTAPEKRAPIMRHLYEMINLLVQKRMTGFTMLHDAMLQYYLNLEIPSAAAAEFVDLVIDNEEGDLLKNLAFTASGARLVSLLMANGSAKDRKVILRAYRGHMQTLAFDPHGYQVLLTALQVVDDTVLLTKLVYGELLTGIDADPDKSLIEELQHPTARIPLNLPFAFNPASILPQQGHSFLAEIQAIRVRTSKKDPVARSDELIRSVAPTLLSCIARNTMHFLSSSFGCLCIQEVLLSSPPDLVERGHAIDALISLLNPDQRGSTDNLDIPAIDAALDAPTATRLLKNLVYSGHFNNQSGHVELCSSPLGFAGKLYEAAFAKGSNRLELLKWATGLRSFVVEAMLRSDDMPLQYKTELRTLLQSCSTELREAANAASGSDPTANNGTTPKKRGRAKAGKGDGEKAREDAARRVGGRGAKALLELLEES